MQHLDYSEQDCWIGETNWQSPIDIVANDAKKIDWQKQPLIVDFTSHDLTIGDDREIGEQFLAQGQLTLGEQVYRMERLHFHDGSEHFIDGKQTDLEIHFVFHNQQGATLVLAVLGTIDDASKIEGITTIFNQGIQTAHLQQWLPQPLSYYQYTGSLTTPPLGKDITWLVLANAIQVTQADWQAIHDNYPYNHRHIQPLNGRTVLYYQ
ncbi:carbonic anhydrase family protein [Leuconostoc fallax]|uniref:carbonic anhydrase family protein n=1 Tax=Leuconostoc fallax TaxID=1251 RepID=UPI002090F2C3|nr:carbonic anhydrase family protein [Leuconostoc fallax]MCO6184125.1 carbonic anhydrase family protein [Leuconostoc fallax]